MSEKAKGKNKIFIYSLPTFIIFVATVIFSFTPYSKLTWVHLPFHSAVEAIGAIIAYSLSILLLSSQDEQKQEFFKISVAIALIGMGTFDLFHSFVNPGKTFVWLHSSATFLGGILFPLAWLSPKFVSKPLRFSISCLIFASCFSFWSILFPEEIPIMVFAGHFTLPAKFLNLTGGIGFFAGAIWFYKRYHDSLDKQLILFANLCLLFGVSAVIFGYSQIWNSQWWLWHGTRLLAYLIALSLIFIIYKNIEKQQKETVLIELNKALRNIKVLKGFLPICASCKKVRDDKGYWNQIESYVREHSEAEFTHGICPECAQKLYPKMNLNEKE